MIRKTAELLNRLFRKFKNKLFSLAHLVEINGHYMYARGIDRNSLILDLGASTGDFSSQISRDFGCKCYALEASLSSYNLIPDNDLIKKFNLAVCKKSGPVTFYLSSNPDTNSIIQAVSKKWGIKTNITVEGTSLEDFLAGNKIESIDVMKIDTEGAEIEIFDSASDNTLSSMQQICVEFHRFCEDFKCKEDIVRIKKRLENLGFLCITFVKKNPDMLFLNMHKIHLGHWQRAYLKLLISLLHLMP